MHVTHSGRQSKGGQLAPSSEDPSGPRWVRWLEEFRTARRGAHHAGCESRVFYRAAWHAHNRQASLCRNPDGSARKGREVHTAGSGGSGQRQVDRRSCGWADMTALTQPGDAKSRQPGGAAPEPFQLILSVKLHLSPRSVLAPSDACRQQPIRSFVHARLLPISGDGVRICP
jgi:hypothetical protein